MSDDTVRGHPHQVDEPLPDPLEPRDAAAPDAARTPSRSDDGGTGAPAYDAELDAGIDRESYAAALAVVPRVVGLTGARSIVDVGCGSGSWMRACRDLGVPDVVGVDGPQVPPERRAVATAFVEHDLRDSFDLDRRFNLVICVEVAGRLPVERAHGLVADLTTMAPVVLFSSAVPGQTGREHVNEQWSEYWVSLFEAHGWTCRDAVRPWIRTNEQVPWWYRQSLFLAVAPSADAAYSSFPKLDSIRIPSPVDYLRRPDGDVMWPPPGPPPEPAPSPATDGPESAEPDDGWGERDEEPTTAGGASVDGATTSEAAGDPPDAREGGPTVDDPATTAADAAVEPDAAGGDRARREADNAEFWGAEARPRGADDPAGDGATDHPAPPGWGALKRLSRRARRRRRDG